MLRIRGRGRSLQVATTALVRFPSLLEIRTRRWKLLILYNSISELINLSLSAYNTGSFQQPTMHQSSSCTSAQVFPKRLSVGTPAGSNSVPRPTEASRCIPNAAESQNDCKQRAATDLTQVFSEGRIDYTSPTCSLRCSVQEKCLTVPGVVQDRNRDLNPTGYPRACQ